MEIRETTEHGISILSFVGRLDVTTAAEAEEAVRRVAEAKGPRILLDLADLEYISSGGLGVMVVLQNELDSQSGRLALCSLSPFVSDVFKTTNLVRRFEIYPTQDAAVAALAVADFTD